MFWDTPLQEDLTGRVNINPADQSPKHCNVLSLERATSL
jgi:hypothetical protein